MTVGEQVRFVIIRSIGNFLVLFAVFGVFAILGPAIYYEAIFRIMQIRGVSFAVATDEVRQEEKNKKTPGFADVVAGPKEQILIPIDTLFSIMIPKIGASAKVFANVDPSNEKEFLPVLQQGVAHARGTVFPGMKGNIYLFAHSTDNFWNVGRYNAIFYLLKDLKKGDEVVVFSQNVRHNYIVRDSAVVDPKEVSYITNANTGQELLILQTCWPPGTTWQRLMIFAEPK
ncbi:sortase [Candidatus Roizmanbacteria bacterium]|nr:sortase [Candidatus Roizmanbacteria bacterium]